jgi:hypothetical protein
VKQPAFPRIDAEELGLPATVACPFCDGEQTELLSLFGTALSVATYWCRDCRTAFEWIKWDAAPPAPSSSRLPPGT